MSSYATPWTVAHQAPLSIRFCKQEHWSGLLFPSPGDLPNPGTDPRSPVALIWQIDSLPLNHLGSPNSGFYAYLCLPLLFAIGWIVSPRMHVYLGWSLWGLFGIEGRSLRMWLVLLIRGETREGSLSQPCEDTVRNWPFASQEENPHQSASTLI